VHAEPARPALRHRSVGSRQVGHADARPLVLGFRVPQLELSPRASLLRGRAVLSAAGPAARADAVLRAPRHAVAELFGPPLRLADREPRAAHRLDAENADDAGG